MRRNIVLALFSSLLVCAAAQAAAWNVTLIERADDARLDRNRLERAYLGHPGGSAADALAVAMDEAQFELEASKSSVKLKTEPAFNLDAARAAAFQLRGGSACVASGVAAGRARTRGDAAAAHVARRAVIAAGVDRLGEPQANTGDCDGGAVQR